MTTSLDPTIYAHLRLLEAEDWERPLESAEDMERAARILMACEPSAILQLASDDTPDKPPHWRDREH